MSDAGWVRVPPNTIMAAAALLRLAEQRWRDQHGDDADVAGELANRLDRALAHWREQLGDPLDSSRDAYRRAYVDAALAEIGEPAIPRPRARDLLDVLDALAFIASVYGRVPP